MELKIKPLEPWDFGKGRIKVFVTETAIKSRILSWKKSKLHCVYHYPNGKCAWDIILPCGYYNRAARVLNFPERQKNANRVKSGKTVGQVNFLANLAQVKKRQRLVKQANGKRPRLFCLTLVKNDLKAFNLN